MANVVIASSSAGTYRQGDLAVLSAVFTVDGAAADPTTVKVTIARPDGQRQTYTYVTDAVVVKDSTGNYHINASAVVPGTWVYWWHAEGTGQAADEKTFVVQPAIASDAPDASQSLQVDFAQLQRAVGRFLGMGRNPGSWQPNERADVADILRSGLRRFYWPPPLPIPEVMQGQVVHVSSSSLTERPTWSWSFLRFKTTLDLASGTSLYDLPQDFGELLDGGFTFSTDQQSVAIVGEEQIRQLQSQAAQSGVPKYACLRAKAGGGQTKYETVFYPTPDQSLTVSFRYSITPLDLSEASPTPYGGPQHSETILEACLAAAEKTLNDENGLHEKKFLECLSRSIQADRNLTTPTETDVWPLEDVARDLNITKAYLKRLIGRQLKAGPHQVLWSHVQSNLVELALQTGLRKFYAPMVLPGERYSHEWSFLRPIGTITTSSSVYTYDLPSGFIDLQGPLTFAADEGNLWPCVEMVPEYRIRQKLALSTSANRPNLGAVRVKPIDPAGGTHYELVLYPPPDGEYELSFPYSVNPAAMAEDACLPYGGQQHAQSIIEACLAAAEELDGTVNGPHAAKYLECLIASVSLDRRTNCPQTLGYNRDLSDRPAYDGFRSYHETDVHIVTYGGNEY